MTMNKLDRFSPTSSPSENGIGTQDDDTNEEENNSIEWPHTSNCRNEALMPSTTIENSQDSNLLSEEQQTNKRKNKKEHRKCTVCGDRALGFNFDAITCESCKAFFRRNANKTKTKCMFQGSCTIDANTRRFCSACRLNKCFSVGMKKEMILGEDERRKRIQKVMQNRAKKLQQLQKQPELELPSPRIITDDLSQHMESSTNLSKLCVKIEASNQNDFSLNRTTPSSVMWPSLSDQNHLGPSLEACHSIRKSADAGPYHRLLSNSEMRLLDFLESAYCSTFGSTSEEKPLMPEATNLEVLVNHIAGLVKLLIRFAKKLQDFNDLPQPAQISLLKGSLLDCICWRSVQLLNPERGNWINQEGTEIPLNVLNAAFGQVDPGVQDEYLAVFGMIKPLLGNSMVAIAIIQCIVLFTPENSADGFRALTSSTQDKYVILLKNYLEAHHDWATAFEMFAKVMVSINRVKQYTSKHGKSLQQCDASQIDPLLLEVFNITSNVK